MAKSLITVKENGDIILREVQTSYLFCFEPQVNVDDNGNTQKKYKVTAILNKDKHAEAIEKVRGILVERQKEVFKGRLPADRLCLRDGDQTGKEEYENAWILVASEREDNPPACLDRDGKRQVKKSDDKLYSGCIANVMLRFWDQGAPGGKPNKGGKRINANFLGIQWLAEGTRFSSVNRPKADEMFDNEGGGSEGSADGWDDDEGDGL